MCTNKQTKLIAAVCKKLNIYTCFLKLVMEICHMFLIEFSEDTLCLSCNYTWKTNNDEKKADSKLCMITKMRDESNEIDESDWDEYCKVQLSPLHISAVPVLICPSPAIFLMTCYLWQHRKWKGLLFSISAILVVENLWGHFFSSIIYI